MVAVVESAAMSNVPSPSEMAAFNAAIISEFRANAGVLSGNFAGVPMLLLTTRGRKSGKENVAPLAYLPDGDRYVIFGSKGGAPTHPDWYLNLEANGQVTVEVGADRFEAKVTVASGAERDELYARQVQAMPVFADYAQRAGDARVIPVVILERP